MKNKAKKLTWFVGVIFFFLQASHLPLPEARVGVYHNPPLSLLSEEGLPEGFVIDLLKEVAEDKGWHLSFVPCEWEACLAMLEAGQIDLLSPIAFSEERVKRFDFSEETLITNWGQVYLPRGETNLSIVDLAGRKIGVLEGDIHAQEIQSVFAEFDLQAEFVFYDDYAEVMRAVEEREVFGGVVNHLFALQHAQNYEAEQSAIIFNPIEVRFAATKGEQDELLSALDDAIRQMKADEDSVYYQSLNHWFGGAQKAKELPAWLFWLGGGSILFLLALLGLNYFLRGEIARQTNALKQSKEELALILDNIPSMVSYLDPELRYIYANQSYAAWYGFEKEEVVGKFVAEILPPKNYAKVFPRLQEVVATGKTVSYQRHITRYTGEEADLVITYIPHLDSQGKLKAFFATVRDISAIERAGNALKESEAQYRLLVDNALVGIYIIQKGVLVFANQGLAELFGYETSRQMIGTRVQDLVTPQDWRLVQREMAEKESGQKESSYFRFLALHKDGSAFNAEVRSHLIPYQGGQAIQGVLVDVTEMVTVEERFRALSEASFEAIFISEKGSCLEQNLAAEKMFGYTREEALGKPGTDWIVTEDRDRVMQYMLTGYEEPYRTIALRKDGSTFPVAIQAKMMHYKGRAVRVSGLRDITEQARAEEQLTASKERFKKVIAQAPVPMVIADKNGDIEYYNEEFVETFGYTLNDAQTAEAWWQSAYPDEEYRTKVQAGWEKAIAEAAEKGEKTPTQIWDLAAKDGTTRTVEFDMMPLGEISIITMNDITARAAMEENLRESEKKFRDLFEKSQDANLIIVNGSFVDFNQAALDMLGYEDKDALLGAHPGDLSPSRQPDGRDSMEKAEEMIQIALEEGSHRFLWDHQRVDGEKIPVEVLLTTIAVDEDEQVLHTTWKDITEQMEIEKARRETVERLETLINATPDIICFKDGKGRWRAANDAILQLFELEEVDYNGKTDRELAAHSSFYEEALLTCEETDQHAWQARQLSRVDEIIPASSGQVKIYDVIKIPRFDDHGSPESLVVFGRDITEQRHAQDELQKHTQQLEMLDTISMAINSSLDLEKLLTIILEQVGKLIKFDSASIFFVEENERVKIVKTVGDADRFQGESFPLEHTLMRGIKEGTKSLLLADASSSTYYVNWKGVKASIRGWIGVPLYTRDSLIGYLTFDSREVGAFDGYDASLAESISPQIAQALYNARLHREMEKNMQQLGTFNQVINALSSSLELDNLLDLIFTKLAALLPFDSGAIFLYENGGLKIMTLRGFDPGLKGTVYDEESLLFAAIKETGKPLVLRNVQEDERFTAWGITEPIENWLGLPLIVREEVIGFMTLDSHRKEFFYTEEDAEIALTFATQAAQAINNARLYERVIRDANELEKRVQKRTEELQDFVELTAGREIRMAELKETISKLRKQLIDAGQTPIADDPLRDQS